MVRLIDKTSPITAIGETIWGDEVGSVHILQVDDHY
jgi:hypothetical protein